MTHYYGAATGSVNMIYLGNFASVDSHEWDYNAENAHSLVGVSANDTQMKLASVAYYDKHNDGAVNDDDYGSYDDSATYDLGSGAITNQTDSTLTANVTLGLADGSTKTVEVVLVQQTNGDLFMTDLWNAGTLDNLDISSVQIDAITGSNYSGWYTYQSVDNTSITAPLPSNDGVVNGTETADVIEASFVDADGDRIDAGDAVAPQTNDQDIVDAGAGNDSVVAGNEEDLVYAGADNDTVLGGSGDDTIFGDSTLAQGGTGETVRESFEWDQVPDTNGGGGKVDGGDPLNGGFTQNTGTVDVTFTVVSESGPVSTEFSTDQQKVHSITDDGNGVDANSSMSSELDGSFGSATYAFDFSDEVENVSFRINDIDGDGVVKVFAYDAAGNKVAIDVEAGSCLTASSEDGGVKLDSHGGYEEDTSPKYSGLINIAGPVERIEVVHFEDGHDNSGINVTDIYFDATPAGEPGAEDCGDDSLLGGAGDDLIYGQGGDDTIDGGEGNDLLFGDGGATGASETTEPSGGTVTIDTVAGADHTILVWDLGFVNENIAPGNHTMWENDATGEDDVVGNTFTITSAAGAKTVGIEDTEANFDDADASQHLTNTVTLNGETGHAGERLIPEYQYSVQSSSGEVINVYAVELDGNNVVGFVADKPLEVGETYTVQGRVDTTPDVSYASLATSYVDPDAVVDPGTGTGAGDDTCDDGNDVITGGAGDDTAYGQGGDDTIDGGEGNDLIYGDGGGAGSGGLGGVDPVALNFGSVRAGSETASPNAAVDGSSVIYDDVATLEDGTRVSAKMVLVSKSSAALQVDMASSTDYEVLLNANNDNSMQGETATFRLEFFDTDTGAPVTLEPGIVFADLDANGGSEIITINDANLLNVGLGTDTSLQATFNPGALTATGTATGNDDNIDPNELDSQVATVFGPTDSVTFTMTSRAFNSGLNFGTLEDQEFTFLASPASEEGGNDLLAGDLGDDTIFGNGGDDTIDGGEGADLIHGDNGGIGGANGSDDLNQIVNGSFEDVSGLASTGYGFVGTGAIEGWTTADPTSQIDIHNDDRLGVTPTDGENWLDLEASPGNIRVGQDVDGLVDGETYRLSFDVSDAGDLTSDDGPDENLVNVYWGGELVTTIDPSNVDESDFETITLDLVAGAGNGNDRLEFEGTGKEDNLGASIDNVSLIPITEAGIAAALAGNGGNDDITGGEGADTMFGEEGNDTFLVGSAEEGAGDEIVGGNGPDETTDHDVLDLRGAGRVDIDETVDETDDGATKGTVTFEDGSTLAFSQIEEILIDPQNEAPDARDDQVTVPEDGEITFDVLGNDSDPDGDTLEILGTPTANNGTVTVNPDGTLTYTPDENYNGPDEITYTVTDGNGGQDTATVTVGVLPVNDDPVAEDDVATVPEDGSVDIPVLVNDSDVDGDTLSVVPGSPVADHGTVTVNPDGTLTYTPDENYNGPDEITYTVTDGNGGTDTATVAVTVTPVNDAPVAEDDTGSFAADEAAGDVDGNVLDNDSDVDGDTLTVSEVDGDAGNVGQKVAGTNGGLFTINPDGTVDFDANGDFDDLGEGETDTTSVTYTVTDGNGGEDTATVSYTVTGANDAPVAEPDTATTNEDEAVTFDVLGNDSDPDGDTLAILGTPTANNGTVTVNPDGTLTYTPDENYNGPDEITYTVTDGNGGTDTATVAVTVTPVNDDPVAEDDTGSFAADEAAGDVDGNVLDNDSDVDGDTLSVSEVDGDAGNVGQQVAGTNGGLFTINPDGTVDFDANGDFDDLQLGETETTSVTYTVTDGNGGEDTATVTYQVAGDNSPPVAVEDTGATELTDPVTVNVLANDSDPDMDTLSVIDATAPSGTVSFDPAGDITFTPDAGTDGPVEITYTVSDGNGGQDTAVLTITVQDGIVSGTDGGELIDETYVGDPGGDLVDNNDAILPSDTPDDDIIEAGGGDDTILAGDGNDSVAGQAGDDTILGGLGDDTLEGGEGDDTLRGNEGEDTLEGGNGKDSLAGGEGDDLLDGGNDDDTLKGQDGNDTIFGGGGDDLIESDNTTPDANDHETFAGIPVDADPNDDRDFIDAGDGNDTVVNTGDDADTVLGGAGDDYIETGIDDDSVEGGDGDDYVDAALGNDYVEGGAGNDTLIAGIDAFSDYVGDDPVLPNPSLLDPDTFTPVVTDPNQEDGKDTVFGGDGNDIIITGDDADDIDGGADNDTIDAGIDDDTVKGGGGDDSILGGHGSDNILGGSGDDFIDAGNNGPMGGNEPDTTDPVPENDLDYVDGGLGNDTILGGDDDDTLEGGEGDDLIDGGIDEDLIIGDIGNDTLLGGDGDDTIRGGAGNDSIEGGEGDDSILGNTGLDTMDGGAGDDTIAGGKQDDVATGGEGNDLITGDEGNDLLSGEEGDDTVQGNLGNDTVTGGAGHDSLAGGGDDDSIDGGDGDDTLSGGVGDDVIEGGAGDDQISGGEGADTAFGGAGADTFVNNNDGDFVDGGTDGPVDFDQLDMRGSGRYRIVNATTDADGDSTSGTLEFLDENGLVTGSMEYREIENIIPCFTPGTVIATPKGERLVEDLEVGDRVITRDNGIQEIRWLGRRDLEGREMLKAPHLKPVLIRAGSLGNGLPERDLLVSPNHRVLVNNDKTALYFEEREVLAAAKHLTGLQGVDAVETASVSYIHFMFDHHEVVLSNGAWTESFQPGEQTLDGLGNAQRNEIFELFPELRTQEGRESYQAARRSLKKHEAKLLVIK